MAKRQHPAGPCGNRECARPLCVGWRLGYEEGYADGYAAGAAAAE